LALAIVLRGLARCSIPICREFRMSGGRIFIRELIRFEFNHKKNP
jgi:hypothetical protein